MFVCVLWRIEVVPCDGWWRSIYIEEDLQNEHRKVSIRGSMKEKATVIYGRGFLLVLVALRLLSWLMINFTVPIS
jgi:hypothetical protein